jgi:hypothetical protein
MRGIKDWVFEHKLAAVGACPIATDMKGHTTLKANPSSLSRVSSLLLRG